MNSLLVNDDSDDSSDESNSGRSDCSQRSDRSQNKIKYTKSRRKRKSKRIQSNQQDLELESSKLHQLLLTDGVNLNTIPAEATDEKISIYVQSNN
mgnify:FL=1